MGGLDNDNRKSVLFVCLGNFCRSPIAEAVFLDLIKDRSDQKEWKVDSCATSSGQLGSPPDSRSMRVLKGHGIIDYKHIARRIKESDFNDFHYIFGMDSKNISELKSMTPANFRGKLALLGSYDPQNSTGIIRDPYYDSDSLGFEEVYDLAKRGLEAFFNAEGF